MKRILTKIILIVIGSVMAAFGIDLAIYAGFGRATLAVLWEGLSLQLGISIGQASFLVAIVMIVFCWFYDREQIYIGTILYQVIYSWCTDLFAPLLRYTDSRLVNLLIMIGGLMVFSVGTALYAFTDWGRGSYDALTFSFVHRRGWQTKYVRIVLDILCVILGVLLGGKAGICTICTILITGYGIQYSLKLIRKYFGKEEITA